MSNTNTLPKQDRYPGIRAFERHEQGLFYGREQEIKDLFRLVKVEKLVVLFSKSGMGKSSLLNAGLSPLLEENQALPIHIRLQSTALSPLDTLYDALKNHPQKQAPYQSQAELWQSIKTTQFPNEDIPILILDQFEEFFNHPKDKRQEFTRQLAHLVSEEVPEEVEEWLLQQPLSQRTAETLQWHSPPEVRVILVIRSDRLSELNEMSAEIPLILHNRFELKALNHRQAKAAIIQPAQLEDRRFDIPAFGYQKATIDEMLRNLDPKNQNAIESFQLQILCGEIEKQVKTKIQPQSQNANSQSRVTHHESPITITPDYLGGKEGIKKILNNYYENRIAELGSKAEQLTARNLIEEQLITDGHRSGVDARKIKITPNLLKKLLDSRLIRVSNTHLGKMYEISHDTLVEPILKSRNKRKLAEERQKRIKAFFVVVIALAFAVGAFLFGAWAFQQKTEAEHQKEIANQHLQDFKNERAAKYMRDAQTFAKSENWELVEESYQNVLKLLSEEDKRKDSIQHALDNLNK